MSQVFNTKNCEKIRASFELSNNNGFIPLYTRLFLDLQDGTNPHSPIFTTPMHLTDASIPITKPFTHNKGLLYFETYLSYYAIDALPEGEITNRIKDLNFSYKVYDCETAVVEFKKYDFGPYRIESKKLLYFVTLIDLV